MLRQKHDLLKMGKFVKKNLQKKSNFFIYCGTFSSEAESNAFKFGGEQEDFDGNFIAVKMNVN